MPLRNQTVLMLVIFLLFAGAPAGAGAGSQLSAVIHVHSSFSSGRLSPAELVAEARARRLDVLVLTDHDRVAMEYGLPPFRRLLKLGVEKKSVVAGGPGRFLAEVARLNAAQSAVMVVPGVQTSPFYYWSGSPWAGGLTANGIHKELLLIGMGRAEDYRGLPVPHNGFSRRYAGERLPGVVPGVVLVLLGAALFFSRSGRLKWGGAFLGVVGLLVVCDRHPFPSSRYDPYHGDQGIAPYQEVIDYTRRRGGLVFWAHPESNYAVDGVRVGPVMLKTERHAEDLEKAQGYTGFAALYGDTSTITEPGALWDRLLLAYCRGERHDPVWGIAEADYHGERGESALDTFQTVLLVGDRTPAAMLGALAEGRSYAVQKAEGYRLVLDGFEAHQPGSGRSAGSGETLGAGPGPVVRLRLAASDGSVRQISVDLIRGGEVVRSFEGATPMAVEFTDAAPWGKTYYRVAARGEGDSRLLSNPIFVDGRS